MNITNIVAFHALAVWDASTIATNKPVYDKLAGEVKSILPGGANL